MFARTTGIILAAGDGGRLGPVTANTPKPLVVVGGRPLVSYTIESLTAAGVRDLVVVTGFRGWEVQAALGDGAAYGASITYIANDHYLGGNGYSLYCARDFLRGRGAIVTMADHLISKELVELLLAGDPYSPRLAVDLGGEEPWVLDESTKVRMHRDGQIFDIGKQLRDFDAVDTGAFYLTPDILDYFPSGNPDLELSQVIRPFLRRPGGFYGRDVTGAFWWDIDTVADLLIAETRLRGRREAVI